MISPIQLSGSTQFTEIIFSEKSDYDSSKDTFRYDFIESAAFNFEREDESLYDVKLTVESKDENNIPIYIRVSSHATFVVLDENLQNLENKDEKHRIIVSNACSVLYGTIRQKIVNTTLQMPFNDPIVLPLLHPRYFIQGMESLNNKPKRKKVAKKRKGKVQKKKRS